MYATTFLLIILVFIGCSFQEDYTSETSAVTLSTQEVVISQFNTKEKNRVYSKCVSCHGKNAEVKALNKSKVIAGWSVKKLTKALQGYKNGSYGGELKGMMKAQVMSLSKQDIRSVSQYISQLK